MTSLDLAKHAARILDAKKAENLKVIRIDEISSLSDYFVIATGVSSTHVKALADELEEKLKKEEGIVPSNIEGYRSNSWILLDYLSVVVHIFTQDGRSFYDLDRMWTDGTPVELVLLPTEQPSK